MKRLILIEILLIVCFVNTSFAATSAQTLALRKEDITKELLKINNIPTSASIKVNYYLAEPTQGFNSQSIHYDPPKSLCQKLGYNSYTITSRGSFYTTNTSIKNYLCRTTNECILQPTGKKISYINTLTCKTPTRTTLATTPTKTPTKIRTNTPTRTPKMTKTQGIIVNFSKKNITQPTYTPTTTKTSISKIITTPIVNRNIFTPTKSPTKTRTPSPKISACNPMCQNGQICKNGACEDEYKCKSLAGSPNIQISKNGTLIGSYKGGCTLGNIDGMIYKYVYAYRCPTDNMPQNKPIKAMMLCDTCGKGATCLRYYSTSKQQQIKEMLLNKGYVNIGSNFYEPSIAQYTPRYQTPTPTVMLRKKASPIKPRLECITDNGDGFLTAYFGYENNTEKSLKYNVGKYNEEVIQNYISGNYYSKFNMENEINPNSNITEFKPGVKKGVMQVIFKNTNLNSVTWNIQHKDGELESVTADANSPKCENVIPKFECMDIDSLYRLPFAIFSYENKNEFPIYIPVGKNNSIDGITGGINQGQPELFFPGNYKKAVSFRINSVNNVTWKLKDNKGNNFLSDKSSRNLFCDDKCTFINTYGIKKQFITWVNNYKNVANSIQNIYVFHPQLNNFNKKLFEFLDKIDTYVINETIYSCPSNNCTSYKVTYKTNEFKQTFNEAMQLLNNEINNIKNTCNNLNNRNSGYNQNYQNPDVIRGCQQVQQIINKAEIEGKNILQNIDIFNTPLLTNRTVCSEKSNQQ